MHIHVHVFSINLTFLNLHFRFFATTVLSVLSRSNYRDYQLWSKMDKYVLFHILQLKLNTGQFFIIIQSVSSVILLRSNEIIFSDGGQSLSSLNCSKLKESLSNSSCSLVILWCKYFLRWSNNLKFKVKCRVQKVQ